MQKTSEKRHILYILAAHSNWKDASPTTRVALVVSGGGMLEIFQEEMKFKKKTNQIKLL
jgi:hypothetical protein